MAITCIGSAICDTTANNRTKHLLITDILLTTIFLSLFIGMKQALSNGFIVGHAIQKAELVIKIAKIITIIEAIMLSLIFCMITCSEKCCSENSNQS